MIHIPHVGCDESQGDSSRGGHARRGSVDAPCSDIKFKKKRALREWGNTSPVCNAVL